MIKSLPIFVALLLIAGQHDALAGTQNSELTAQRDSVELSNILHAAYEQDSTELSVISSQGLAGNETLLQIAIPEGEHASLKLVDLLGNCLDVVPLQFSAGNHYILLSTVGLPATIYFYVLECGSESLSGRI